MRCIFVAILIHILSSYNICAQTLYSIEKNGLFGYADSIGNVVIEPMYGFVHSSTFENVAFVAIEEKIIAIDRNNKHLFRVHKIDNGPDYVSEGLFRIINKKDEIGFADTLGSIIIEPQYKFAFPFQGGKAKVTNKR